jgi:hypothetical protein
MIIDNKSAVARLASPMNLINQLRNTTASNRKSAMSLFGIGKKKEEIIPYHRQTAVIELWDKIPEKEIDFNPFKPQAPPLEIVPPPVTNLDSILENHEGQIKLGLAHDNALDLLTRSIGMLSVKLDEVSAAKLPTVITAAGKVVESIRKERIAIRANGSDREVHYHFYTPNQKVIKDFEVIDVGGV